MKKKKKNQVIAFYVAVNLVTFRVLFSIFIHLGLEIKLLHYSVFKEAFFSFLPLSYDPLESNTRVCESVHAHVSLSASLCLLSLQAHMSFWPPLAAALLNSQ